MREKKQLVVIGARLRAARIAAGMTQTAVAKSIGMSKQIVSSWKKGELKSYRIT